MTATTRIAEVSIEVTKEVQYLLICVMDMSDKHLATSSLWNTINTTLYGSVVDVSDRLLSSVFRAISKSNENT